MSAIHFTTVVGPDGVIHPPPGVKLPEGEIEVSVRPPKESKPSVEEQAREFAARRGFNWDALPEDLRAILIEDVQYKERGLRRPLPGPGACKGMVLDMAPDFDAPLEDMKEYMDSAENADQKPRGKKGAGNKRGSAFIQTSVKRE